MRATINLEQFQNLVCGKAVKLKAVSQPDNVVREMEVILADIGFDQMTYAVEFAKAGGSEAVNKARVVDGVFYCTCGNSVGVSRVRNADGNITCPSCNTTIRG